MTSVHLVLGRPRLRFPRDGFHRYSLFGTTLLSIGSRCPNHFSLRFLINLVSWGCLVTDLMCLLVTCWDHLRGMVKNQPLLRGVRSRLLFPTTGRRTAPEYYINFATHYFRK